jgi:hypothetical protein
MDFLSYICDKTASPMSEPTQRDRFARIREITHGSPFWEPRRG